MKRAVPVLVAVVIAVGSIVFAQSLSQATMRTPSGDKPISVFQQGGHTFFSVEEVIVPLGGTVAPDNLGFRVTVNGKTGAFAPDSRFGVIRDDLIEMPVAPLVVDGKPYVPWQFFQGFLRAASNLDVNWDATTHVLDLRPQQAAAVTAEMSVVEIEGISKVVVELSGPADYAVTREPGSYNIRFRTPVRPPFGEQAFENNPHLTKAVFHDNTLTLLLTGSDVAGNSYKLENPFRIVLDLQKGVAPTVIGLPDKLRVQAVEEPGIKTIVLDPGHGGKDVGAIGPDGLAEKDVTLNLCRKLSPLLASKLNARVILTRDDDSMVPLTQRTAIANKYKADLFLSVHVNASVSKQARGSETYFLSLEASDELARNAADRENQSAAGVPDAQANSSELKLILWDLAQQEYLKESSRFAELVQDEMSQAMGIENRGVKQAPFKVLVGATMPAALVEIGFISNADEETRLKDEQFQNALVDALVRATGRFKSEYEVRLGIASPQPAVPLTATSAPATAAPTAPANPVAPAPVVKK